MAKPRRLTLSTNPKKRSCLNFAWGTSYTWMEQYIQPGKAFTNERWRTKQICLLICLIVALQIFIAHQLRQ